MLARLDRTPIKKERPVFGFLQRRFCLPSTSGAPGCGPGLVRGTRLPACRICCLFTISKLVGLASDTLFDQLDAISIRLNPEEKRRRRQPGHTLRGGGTLWTVTASTGTRHVACATPTGDLRGRAAQDTTASSNRQRLRRLRFSSDLLVKERKSQTANDSASAERLF